MIEIWLSLLTVALLVLYARIIKKQPMTESNSAYPEQLTSFIEEFEKENKELVQSIARIKRTTDLEMAGLKAELSAAREQISILTKQYEQLHNRMEEIKFHAVGEEGQNVKVDPSLLFLKDEYREIPQLYAQGLTSQEIARKLGIGNGEVEMVIQMIRRQEKDFTSR